MLTQEDREERSKVREILLLPIESNKKVNKIFIGNNVIYTGQKYYSSADEDMSDFTVEFYKIIYSDILNGLLDKKGYLFNCNYAGDTMNSFNAIANLVSEAGKTSKERTPKEKWPDYLRIYSDQYHCLANFWILPICIGRRSAKLNRYDSMGIFLNLLREDYDVLKKHTDYYLHINKFDEFCTKHFLPNIEYPDTNEIVQKYKEGNAEYLVGQAISFIENRANIISSNKDVCKKLYQYFNSLGIIAKAFR